MSWFLVNVHCRVTMDEMLLWNLTYVVLIADFSVNMRPREMYALLDPRMVSASRQRWDDFVFILMSIKGSDHVTVVVGGGNHNFMTYVALQGYNGLKWLWNISYVAVIAFFSVNLRPRELYALLDPRMVFAPRQRWDDFVLILMSIKGGDHITFTVGGGDHNFRTYFPNELLSCQCRIAGL